MRLWIAEGFIKKVQHKSLEDVAEENLRELVDRSLLLVGKHSSLGKIKTCKMHDLVRDMCLREAQNENFIHIIPRYGHEGLLRYSNNLRRVADFNDYTHSVLSILMPLTRSVFFKYPYEFCFPSRSCFRLLRILDVCFIPYFDKSKVISELVHLRYLACSSYHGLVQSICKLRNIQILVIYDGRPRGFMTTVSLPWEVLNMPQLRHIHTKDLHLFIPPPTSLIAKTENHLQTLSRLMPSSCNDEMFLRIPNVKKLGISLVSNSAAISRCYCLDNLVHLTQLEKLKVEFKEDYLLCSTWMSADREEYPISPRLRVPHCDNFPPNLKKLTLCTTHLQWEDMNILSKLPNLEVLKLKDHAFHGQVWKLSDEEEDGFSRLKFLLLEEMNLKQWEATSYHFPCLEHLVLTDCYLLEQIPFEFSDIQTLQLIELHKCKLSVIASAEQIQEEQQSLGIDELIVRARYIDKMMS